MDVPMHTVTWVTQQGIDLIQLKEGVSLTLLLVHMHVGTPLRRGDTSCTDSLARQGTEGLH